MRSVDEKPYQSIVTYYRKQGIRVQVVAFQPAAIPMVMKYPHEAEFIRDSRSAKESDELPNSIMGLIENYVNDLPVDEAELAGTLYINSSCSVIQTLNQMPDGSQRNAMLTIFYHYARLFASRLLTAQDATNAFHEIVYAAEDLLQ
jgi:hypothetical protein